MNSTTYGRLVNGEIEYSLPTVTLVKLHRVEGKLELAIVYSIHEADMVLQDWAWDMEEDRLGYDKVDFTVYFSNGHCHEGRFDVKALHRRGADLKEHMVGHLEWVIGHPELVGANYAQEVAELLPLYRSL